MTAEEENEILRAQVRSLRKMLWNNVDMMTEVFRAWECTCTREVDCKRCLIFFPARRGSGWKKD